MIKINKERIKNEFVELTSIDSPSYGERKMADCVRGKLRELGFLVSEDDAAVLLHESSVKECDTCEMEGFPCAAGNLYGFLRGTLPGEPVLLSAHLDTVQPAYGKQAVFHEDGRITSRGDTVLGADDVAGLIEILEGIRCVQETHLAHRDIEVLFSVAEELHCKGSAVFDYSRVKAKEAYVFDLSGPVGSAAVGAPSIVTFEATMTGKAAHAGFAPEDGIHAIAVMCDAISRIPQGRIRAGALEMCSYENPDMKSAGKRNASQPVIISEETTLNIGSIRGGGSTNVVPDTCVCTGEIRSCSHMQAMEMAAFVRRIFEESANRAGARCEVKLTVNLTAYRTDTESHVVRRFQKACEKLSLPGRLTTTFGGSDNNNFAFHGISGIVVSCGMCDVHSLRESIHVEDLVTGAQLAAELIC